MAESNGAHHCLKVCQSCHLIVTRVVELGLQFYKKRESLEDPDVTTINDSSLGAKKKNPL